MIYKALASPSGHETKTFNPSPVAGLIKKQKNKEHKSLLDSYVLFSIFYRKTIAPSAH